MGILGDDDDDAGALALAGVRKVAKAFDAMNADVQKMKTDLLNIERGMAKVGGQIEALLASQGKVSVGIQSDNIKNIGVAEGGSKVEQANG